MLRKIILYDWKANLKCQLFLCKSRYSSSRLKWVWGLRCVNGCVRVCICTHETLFKKHKVQFHPLHSNTPSIPFSKKAGIQREPVFWDEDMNNVHTERQTDQKLRILCRNSNKGIAVQIRHQNIQKYSGTILCRNVHNEIMLGKQEHSKRLSVPWEVL